MKKYSIILFISALLLSCTQEEYMPDPYGEPIPYEETERANLDTELTNLNLNLFKLLIDKSNVRDLLNTEWKNLSFTFLAPSDDAFIKAGYDEQKLNSMLKEELDSMIMYHALIINLDTTVNLDILGNLRIRTKLTNNKFRTGTTPNVHTFVYTHSVTISNDELIVNGKPVGKYQVTYTKEADIIPIHTFLERPRKTIWETMKEDNRLSMFMRVLEVTDSIYRAKRSWEQAIKTRLDYNRSAYSYNANLQFTSVIAPSNEAFIKAGFDTPEKFLQLNDPYINKIFSYAYYSDGYPYDYQTFLKTDSIISFHSSWGEKYYPMDSGTENPQVFYSNELKNEQLANYVLVNEGRNGMNRTPTYYNPFVFSNENGEIKIKLKKAKEGTDAAKVIESDIQALNGPIHIVDRLFIPDDF